MAQFLRAFLTAGTLLVFAGCMSSGSGDGADGGQGGSGSPTIQDQIDLASQLADEIEPLDSVSGASLPDTGSVDYTGNLGITVNDGTIDQVTLFGSMTMTANFVDSLITGDVTDFVDTEEVNFSGTATLENGAIDDTAIATETISADLTGTITGTNGQVIDFDANLLGGFYGVGETHVAGDVEGNITIDSVVTAIDNGQFAASE